MECIVIKNLKHELWKGEIGTGLRLSIWVWKRMARIKWIDTASTEEVLITMNKNRTLNLKTTIWIRPIIKQ